MIRGATGIIDKVDLGGITMPVTQEEISMLSRLLNELNINPPTQVTDIYKSRRSRYKNVRIWSATDLGTGRIKDLFMTNQNFELIKVDKIDIQIEDDFNLIINSLDINEEEGIEEEEEEISSKETIKEKIEIEEKTPLVTIDKKAGNMEKEEAKESIDLSLLI